MFKTCVQIICVVFHCDIFGRQKLSRSTTFLLLDFVCLMCVLLRSRDGRLVAEWWLVRYQHLDCSPIAHREL